MSFIGSMFGQNGTGLNFRAKSADLITPTTAAQADTTFQQSQDALAKQNAFLQALQGQNGVTNQSDVFNQLKNVAAGTGPNPAQAMLNQSTGNNIASQAALMAGQRGSSANPALVARMAAQQGGTLQQQAVGQGATMQANQSLNAINQMGGLATQQVGQQAGAVNAANTFAQGEQGQILNAIAGQNSNKVANMAQENAANAGIAGIAAKGQQDLLGGAVSGVGTGAVSGVGTAAAAAHGGMIPPKRMADGGAVTPTIPEVPPMAAPQAPTYATAPKQGPMSAVGKHLSQASMAPGQSTPSGAFSSGQTAGTAIGQGLKSLFGSSTPTPGSPASMPSASDWSSWAKTPEGSVPSSAENYSMMKNMPDEKMARGGKVPAKVSPGELYLKPQAAQAVAAGKANPLAVGERIPGKAKVKGDSYANDTVSKKLDAGGVVVPRSEMDSEDPMEHARRFVAAVYAQGRKAPMRKAKSK